MSRGDLTEDVVARLEKRADAATKAWGEKYFLGVIELIGVKRAGVNAVLREVLPAAKALSSDALVHEALVLLRDPRMEPRQIAIDLLHRRKRDLDPDFVDVLARIFDGHVRDWATCDGLSGRVLRPLLPNASARKKIVAWSRSDNLWRQRAAAVSFVNDCKTGLYDDDIIAVCARIVKNPERFVQLGCGWVLRELYLVDAPRTLKFLDDNAKHISREGLRYATEKMPKPVQKRVHDEHARTTGKGRVR
ncbi:MAG TPA: DNA alkylation repair protein [Myxococcota bacterium]